VSSLTVKGDSKFMHLHAECVSYWQLGMTILSVGVNIWWISDLIGVGACAIFHPYVRPAPAP
jgi:hypothetical protein